MNDWYWVLSPLAVLAVLMLFRFVGCGLGTEGLGDFSAGPDYVSTVEDIPGLVHYWRLADFGGPIFNDEVPARIPDGPIPGNYLTAPLIFSTGDTDRHSPVASLGFDHRHAAGLLEFDPTATCVEFLGGGYIDVPSAKGDFGRLTSFTYMAWVRPEWDTTSNPKSDYYCIFEMGAPDADALNPSGQKTSGFGLYAGPPPPGSDAGDNNAFEFQVWVGDGKTFKGIPNKGKNPNSYTVAQVSNGTTYFVAVTLDASTQPPTLALYVHARDGLVDTATATQTQVDYAVNDGSADFLIGAGRNLFPNVATRPTPPVLYPFQGKIQEVAIFASPLSISALASPVLVGGA
jgi:hypothetical protein